VARLSQGGEGQARTDERRPAFLGGSTNDDLTGFGQWNVNSASTLELRARCIPELEPFNRFMALAWRNNDPMECAHYKMMP
jgi:hypothetical protein